jgi:hypothetical protein
MRSPLDRILDERLGVEKEPAESWSRARRSASLAWRT